VATGFGAAAALLLLAAALEELEALEELAAELLVALVAELETALLVAELVAPPTGPSAAGFWSLEHPAAASSSPVAAAAMRLLSTWFRFMGTNLDSPLSGL
jgi:hypothetical protein